MAEQSDAKQSGAQTKVGKGTISAAEIIERRSHQLKQNKSEEVKLSDREDKEPSEADAEARRLAEEEAQIVQILSQGVTSHAMRVQDADPEKRYVWVRDRAEDISRMKALGYELETEKGKGMHGTGDDKRRVGDTILMSVSRERYELIQKVQQRQKERRVNSPVRQYLKQSKEGAAQGTAVPPVDLLAE